MKSVSILFFLSVLILFQRYGWKQAAVTKLVELTSDSSTESDLDVLDMNSTVTPTSSSKTTRMFAEMTTEPYNDLAKFSNETVTMMPTTTAMVDIGSESVLEPVYPDLEWEEPDYIDYDEMAFTQSSAKTLGSANWSKNDSMPKISQKDLTDEELDAVDSAVDEFFSTY